MRSFLPRLRLAHAFVALAIAGMMTLSGASLHENARADVSMSPADDTTLYLESSRVIDTFEAMPDPAIWSKELASGLHYRRATTNEQTVNGWIPGTYLVQAPSLLSLANAPPSVQLLMPRDDTDVRLVTFDLSSSTAGIAHGIVDLTGAATSFEPTFHAFASKMTTAQAQAWVDTFDGAAAQLVAASTGGFSGMGVHDGVMVEILGPETHWQLDAVSTGLGGQVPQNEVSLVILTELGSTTTAASCPLNLKTVCILTCQLVNSYCDTPECANGIDDDSDEWVDMSDPGCSSSSDDDESDTTTSYALGLFGEVKWCTTHKSNWESLLLEVGDVIEQGFRDNGGTRARPSHTASGCVTSSTTNAAQNCDTNGCGTYVFGGCDSRSICYRDNAWSQAVWLRNAGVSIPQVKIAQVVHEGMMSWNGGTKNVCGVASFSGSGSLWHPSTSGDLPSGDSVSIKTNVNCDGVITPTHEVGHNFDAVHTQDCWDQGWDVMDNHPQHTGARNAFCDESRVRVNTCHLNQYCPRSGTG